VWDAINRLAELDLSRYSGKPIFDREAFLGSARAWRVEQHKALIADLLSADPNVTCEQVVKACNPQPAGKPNHVVRTAEAASKLYEINDAKREPLPPAPPDCATCQNTGHVGQGRCSCQRGRFGALVDRLRHKEAS